ncbi:MAG: T9SS type A sorting domain-containing protein [Bacteroidota bacterium]
MKKWYPSLAFGALLMMLCSMSIQGTLSSSASADKLTDLSSVLTTTNEANSEGNSASFSLMAADTQAIDMPLSAARRDTIRDCNAVNVFRNAFEHLYPDTVAHRDTITICPPDNSKRVYITFTDFEIAPGDTLYVYDADQIMPSRQVAKFSGAGVSATGGWIQSECNPSGCLTFEFVTNGDNAKGRGWESWVTCRDRNDLELTFPNIPNQALTCEETYALVTIAPPTPLSICGELQDSFCLTIYNSHGHACLDSCIQAPATIRDTFGVGIYRAVWRLKQYPTYTIEQYFTVSAPTLVCNDEVFTPLGSACAIDIHPDMLLEGPCDTITDTLYYRIEVKIGDDPKNQKTIVGGGGPGIPYPTLEKDTLLRYGVKTLCSGSVDVKITRIYYEQLEPTMSICHGGMVETSCTTTLNFADQSPPFFLNYQGLDTVAACDTIGLMDALRLPTVIANCDTAEVVVDKVQLIDNVNACKTGKVLVTWKATDVCGNSSFLSDTIYIVRPTEFYNPGRTTLNCHEDKTYLDAETPGLLVGEIKNGELIVQDTVHLSTEDYICGYILVPNDEQYPSDCGEKWVRDWKVLDWCNASGGPRKIATQAVLITDTLAPMFIDCPDSAAVGGANNPMLVDLDHFECEINMTPERLGIPKAIDNCDPNPTVSMFHVARLHKGVWDTIGTNLSNSGALFCDTFRIGWLASDICHDQPKQDTCYKYVIIRDVTKPTAVCVDQLNFSVGSDWARIVGVDDVDGGSWDACGIANREISFDGIHWDTTAILSCDAIHDDPKLHLRVTDTKGNQNICWTRINVKDDIYPSCGKLPDVNLWCDEFKTGELGVSTDTNENGAFDDDEYLPLEGAMLDSFNLQYGNPIDICDDNIKCHPMKIEQEYQLAEWPCGQTKILRRYRAIDWGPNKSPWETQLIELQYRPNWELTLPTDWQGDCGEAFPDARLDIRFGACDQIGWEHKDKVFVIEDEACYKVERTYHIINWCLYKAGDKPYRLNRMEDDHGFVHDRRTINHEQFATNGYLTYIQVLKVHSFGGPDISINDVDTCLAGDGMAGPTATTADGMYDCDETRTFSAEATTCIDFEDLDWWWSVFIDNVKVDSGKGSKFNYIVNPGIEYWVSFSASDPCGNSATQNRKFHFTDCKKPTAYCRAGTGITLGQEGKIEIWASDVDLGSFDNCTPKDLLRLRLWHASLGEPPANIDQVLALPSNITFDCQYVGSQIVRLYVIDKERQYSFCTSVVDVQDNMNVCKPVGAQNAFVSGSIQTTDNQMMNNVQVIATDSDGKSIATVTENGLFQLSLPKNNTYTLTPEMDTDPLNGVTTFDLVLISKHILGLQSFNSPYQHIAADVNQSGTISAYDMVQLRQLILNITQQFPNNTSWKFVADDYVFTSQDPAAEAYEESAMLTNMEDEMKVDFMAVKIGDVNQSANFSQSVAAASRSYTAIEVEDQRLEAGETYTVDFKLPTGTELEGYQFTIDFKDLELVDLVESTAKKPNFGFNLTQRGLLTTSWNVNGAAETASDAPLFSLVLKSSTAGQLSEKLSITSSVTAAEAYDADGHITNVRLDFIGDQPDHIQLYQNRPNPFRDNTAIGFYLLEAGKADLSILDVQGKVLKEVRGTYEKGYHEIQLNAADLSETGVLYYQLTTDKKQVVKRMIVVE